MNLFSHNNLASLILSVLLASSIVTCCRDTAYAQQQSLRVGVIIPLSGGLSSNGEAIRNSIVLADELNDKSNLVEFIFEDDRFQPKQTVSAMRKLISSDRVAGVIVFGSPTSLAVNNIAEQHALPMISFSVLSKVVEGKRYVVKHWVTAADETELLNREVNRRGYRSIAIVSMINDAMLELRNLFRQAAAAQIVLDEEFNVDDVDFRSVITKIKKLNPDAVYVLLWAPQPGIFVKSLRGSGYRGAIFGVHNLEDPGEIVNSAGTLNDAWLVSGNDCNSSTYYKLYAQRFGGKPAFGGINGFDAATLFIEAIASGDINKYLHEVRDFQGAYGNYSATSANDFSIAAAIKEIKNNTVTCITIDK